MNEVYDRAVLAGWLLGCVRRELDDALDAAAGMEAATP